MRDMRLTRRLPIALLLIVVVVLPSLYSYPVSGSVDASSEAFAFYGVTYGGNTTAGAKLLIDKVKGYTNLFVVDNWDIGMNETLLTEVCDYAVDAGLYVMVYFDFLLYPYNYSLAGVYNSTWNSYGIEMFHVDWLKRTEERWGDKFVGVYLADEPGGNQIDSGYWTGDLTTLSGRPNTVFANVTSYSDAANRHVRSVRRGSGMNWLVNSSYPNSIPNSTGRSIQVFTADNALYWFDYMAGYTCVFAELGWNHNEPQHIGLCRGAANVQGKEWGAIITWATNDPPYMATGTQMLQQLNTAYDAGAKYVIVFNYPQINEYGALEDEHFAAMEAFWNRMQTSPRSGRAKASVAVVLPKDYGWGMRQANDRIWGLWPADELSPVIGEKIVSLINEHGLNLDIIYDDPQFNYVEKYQTIHFWNGTTLEAPWLLFGMPVSSLLYPSLVTVAVVMTCVPSYIVVKNRKRRAPKQVAVQLPQAKAILINQGKCELELDDDKIKFFKQKGRLKKRRQLVKEIPIADIEGAKQIGNELSVTYKGMTDTFAVQNLALLEKISQRINERLDEQRKTQQDRALLQKRILKVQRIGLDVVDSLFDVLRNLHQKRIDWSQIESCLSRSQKLGISLNGFEPISLDYSKLNTANERHLPKEVSKETYSLLKTVHDYFSLLATKSILPEGIHPDYKDAKTMLLAYYTLNDVILSSVVGDKNNHKEIDELLLLVEAMPKAAEPRVSISQLKDAINRLGAEVDMEGVIEECRMLFRDLLQE